MCRIIYAYFIYASAQSLVNDTLTFKFCCAYDGVISVRLRLWFWFFKPERSGARLIGKNVIASSAAAIFISFK